MKISTDAPILTTNGEQAMYVSGGTDEKPTLSPMTMRNAMIEPLLVNEKNLSGEEKMIRYKLAQKLMRSNGSVELTTKEMSKISDLAAKYSPVLVYGQVMDALDAAHSADKPSEA